VGRNPRHRRGGRAVTTPTCVVIALLGTTACGSVRRATEDVFEHQPSKTFFAVPKPLHLAPPGTIIRRRRLLGAIDGAIAWRVLYHSRDASGHDIAVSGIVVAPTGPAPNGGRPIVSWAHPTTGTATKCAPSTGVDPFITVEGLRDLVADGYVVAATDYSGMGATGPPSYLIGVTEANNVLDAAIAAHAIPDAGASNQVLLWGHSQGGQAVLFAAQRARAHAPELKIIGVAAAAPAVELGQLLDNDIHDEIGVILAAYAINAYATVYARTTATGSDAPSAQLTTILTSAGATAVPKIAMLCSLPLTKPLTRLADPLVGRFLRANPAAVEPWASWLVENTPTGAGIAAPVFIAQGTDDTVVTPSTTAAFARKLCANGTPVTYDSIKKTGHALVALRAVGAVRAWFADLLAHRTIRSRCPA
jgi:pimeloyl-ACP methyl ester carboxylesterase